MTTTALITGGTSGIGRAVADKLAQSGVHVMVVGRNVERGDKTIAELRAAGAKADFISSDLRDDGRSLRRGGPEPLWIEQSRHQSADQGVGGRIRPPGRSRECGQSRTDP